MYAIHIKELIAKGFLVMHLNKLCALFAGFLFVFSFASAASVEVPSDVYFFEKPTAFPVEIVNDSPVRKSLSVEFFAPVDFEYIDSPSSLPGDSEQRVALVLYPKSSFTGSSYLSTLVVKLGDKTFVKSVKLHFNEKKEQEQGNEGTEGNGDEEDEEDSLLTGFFSFFAFDFLGFELLLDILLVILASILLIAFISRYSKRVVQR